MNFLRPFSQYPPSSRQFSRPGSGASRRVLSACAKRPFTWVRVVTAAADPPANRQKKLRRETSDAQGFMAGLLIESDLGDYRTNTTKTRRHEETLRRKSYFLTSKIRLVYHGYNFNPSIREVRMLGRKWAYPTILFVVLAFPSTGATQTTRETLLGATREARGAVVPNVQVTARNVLTSFTRSATTDANGSYIIPNLPVGPYSIAAECQGFRRFVQEGVKLLVNKNAR